MRNVSLARINKTAYGQKLPMEGKFNPVSLEAYDDIAGSEPFSGLAVIEGIDVPDGAVTIQNANSVDLYACGCFCCANSQHGENGIFSVLTVINQWTQNNSDPRASSDPDENVDDLDPSIITSNPMLTLQGGAELLGEDQQSIYVFFVNNGVTAGNYSVVSTPSEWIGEQDWSQSEKDIILEALADIEAIIDVQFVITSNQSEADLEFLKNDNNTNAYGVSDLNLSGSGTYSTGYISINHTADNRWNDGREKGGRGYETLVHEIGHALGLGHTHDTGRGTLVIESIVGYNPFTSGGALGIIDPINSIMAYRDGWAEANGGVGTSQPAYGNRANFGAWDIQALINRYGANTSTNAGNDTYTLPQAALSGTYFETIWDNGGDDTISASGSNYDAVIDLRSATLDDAPETTGGPVSYLIDSATGLVRAGGFTIAGSTTSYLGAGVSGTLTPVIIENAIGGNGNDILRGNIYDNDLQGRNGDDEISGDSGNDSLNGNSGYDTLKGGAGADFLNGGHDADTIEGGEGNDEIFGGTADDLINGGADSDTISGGSGSDVIDGGTGHDDIAGGAGADSIIGNLGDDSVTGNSGNDDITGGSGYDLLLGGDGNDTVNGGADDDTIHGTKGFDLLFGGTGNDFMTGGNDNDTLAGGVGNDEVYGSTGDDVVDGDDGHDLVAGGDGHDTVSGGAGNDNVSGTKGDDLVAGDGGNDTVIGGDGNDTLLGGDGLDQLFGGADNDVINGGAGNDTMTGFIGDDSVDGGAGDDQLTGGAGFDLFIYDANNDGGADVIADFNGGIGLSDTIQITGATDFADLLSMATESSGHVIFDFGNGNTLTLKSETIANLEAEDFSFI